MTDVPCYVQSFIMHNPSRSSVCHEISINDIKHKVWMESNDFESTITITLETMGEKIKKQFQLRTLNMNNRHHIHELNIVRHSSIVLKLFHNRNNSEVWWVGGAQETARKSIYHSQWGGECESNINRWNFSLFVYLFAPPSCPSRSVLRAEQPDPIH